MHTSQPEPEARIHVRITRDLEDIVPIFLANRSKDLRILREALDTQDFMTIQTLGHRMKGDGGGYGFDRITQIGTVMELAAKREDRPAVEQHLAELEDFLKRVEVVYQ
jgi:histidine phosphotransfer protein HptB